MEEKRLAANDCFKKGDLAGAVDLYSEAVSIYDSTINSGALTTPEARSQATDEAVKSLGNLSLCCHKLKRYDECIQHCSKVLGLNAFFAKGHAFLGMSLFDKESSSLSDRTLAMSYFATAINLLPAMATQLGERMTTYRAQLKDSLLEMEAKSPTGSSPASTLPSKQGVDVKVMKTKNCGKGVVACKDLTLHTVVASLTQPFSVGYYDDWTPKENQEPKPPKLCVNCGKSAVHDLVNEDGTVVSSTSADDGVAANAKCFRDCPKCHGVSYCGEVCAAVYASRHSEFECVAFQKLRLIKNRLLESSQPDLAAEAYELGSHLITTLSGLKSSLTVSGSQAGEKISGMDFISQLDGHDDEVVQSLAPLPGLMYDLFPDEHQPLINHLLGVIRCNALQLNDDTGLGVGQAVFTGDVSYYNHSCEPNATIDVENRFIKIIRPIREGEDICISYIPQLYWPRRLRREGLHERYFFHCKCRRCNAEASYEARRAGEKEALSAEAQDEKQLAVLVERRDLCVEKILTANSPDHAPKRSDATRYYHDIVQNIAEGSRGRMVEEVDEAMLQEVQKLKDEILQELHPLHYLVQDLRNAERFVASVLGKASLTFTLAREEFNYWQMVVPGAFPTLADHLRNMARCVEVLQEQQSKSGASADSASAEMTVAERELWALFDVQWLRTKTA